MPESVDIILLLSHHGLQLGKTDAAPAPGTEIRRWLNAHAMPLSIGASSEYVEDGGVRAIYLYGEELGELAAVHGLNWLKARSKKDLPLIESGLFRIGSRDSMLSKRKLTLPRIYREAAHLENLYYPWTYPSSLKAGLHKRFAVNWIIAFHWKKKAEPSLPGLRMPFFNPSGNEWQGVLQKFSRAQDVNGHRAYDGRHKSDDTRLIFTHDGSFN